MRVSEKRRYRWYIRIFLWFQRRRYGTELLPAKAWGRSPRVFAAVASLHGALNRKRSPLSPKLRSLVSVRVAELSQCAFCVDLNTAILKKRGGAQELSESDKIAIEYAEAIIRMGRVSDEIFEKLKEYFTEDQIVELTGLIAFQNLSSKFNVALEIPSQHLAE